MKAGKDREGRQFGVVPGKTMSAAYVLQAVMGILFLLFGIVFFYFRVRDVSEAEPELALLISLFGAIWVIGCGLIAGFGIYALKKRKAALFTVEVGSATPPKGDFEGSMNGDFDERLRKLESLKKEGLISDREYAEKRAQIMGEKW